MRGCTSLLLVLALALMGCLVHDDRGQAAPAWQVAAAEARPPNTEVNLTQLREESLGMFQFGYSEYMRRAFPKDDLRPISCRGKDSQGGIALTLIDALDTLIVMGEKRLLQEAVHWLAANVTFDVDARVHVFELTIRAVGGLLSTHMLIQQDPSLVPGYDGSLLRLAVDLTDRFMPAFETPTGVPLSWVNLRHGQIPGDVRSTCTACAGTLLLEFGVLSRLTGNATYEAKARHAVETIFVMRSPRGLVGNTLDCDSGKWVRTDAGVGAGVDSFYEYLLKAYLAFGDVGYLDMFKEVYAAAMTYLQLDPQWNGHVWLVDVDMQAGHVLHPYVWSLGAFWPGLQALAGQVEEGVALHANWTAAWIRFGWLPEMFDVGMENRHPTETGYPLRPELMESNFVLHAATGDPRLLGVGAALHQRLRDKNRVACGYASVSDVSTGQLEDTMESFFLSETVKYLYLLFSNASALVDHFVLSTEGHLLLPFPDTFEGVDSGAQGLLLEQQRHLNASGAAQGQAQQGGARMEQQQQERQRPAGGLCYWSDSPARQGRQQQEQQGKPSAGVSSSSSSHSRSWAGGDRWGQVVAEKCEPLCRSDQAAADTQAAAAQALHSSLPLLPLPTSTPALLRQRRCTACREVTAAVRHAQHTKELAVQQAQRSKEAAAMAKLRLSNMPAVAVNGLAVNRQFLCVMEDTKRGTLGCTVFKEILPRQISRRHLNALPQNYMLIQLTESTPQMQAAAVAVAQQRRRQQVEVGAAGGGDGTLPADPAAGYRVVVEMQLDNGSRSHFEGMLADFGPVVESGCGEAEAGISRRSRDTARQPPLPPAAMELQFWRGQRLEVREGGKPGRTHRLVYLINEVESDEDDPYEDPNAEEEEAAPAAGSSTSTSASAGAGKSGSGGSGRAAVLDLELGAVDEGDEEDGAFRGYTGAARITADFPSMVLCSAEGTAVAAQPLDACSPLQNAAEVAGSIAVVQRGGCMFIQKALAAQRAGAVAVVVVDWENQVMAMGTDEQGSQSDIAVVLIPRDNGSSLLGALHALAAKANASDSDASGSRGSSSSSGRVRLRVFSPREATAAAAAQERCALGGRALEQPQQQVELLMSSQAQLWLFNKVAASSNDPSATFSRILSQIRAHFQSAALEVDAGDGAKKEEEE